MAVEHFSFRNQSKYGREAVPVTAWPADEEPADVGKEIAVAEKTTTVQLSRQGASILRMLAPFPWEKGPYHTDSFPAHTARSITVDREGLEHMLVQAGAPGFPAGDRRRLQAAVQRLGGRIGDTPGHHGQIYWGRARERSGERAAWVTGSKGEDPRAFRDRVARYLPANYHIAESDEDAEGRPSVEVQGHDNAGWTLDEYVIPRLRSGLMVAVERPPGSNPPGMMEKNNATALRIDRANRAAVEERDARRAARLTFPEAVEADPDHFQIVHVTGQPRTRGIFRGRSRADRLAGRR